jgi:rhodanese-related sulfurtransferase
LSDLDVDVDVDPTGEGSMPIPRISPEEALERIEREGFVYVDVRSVPEFEAGHPSGAYNVPLNHQGPRGMAPNPDFLPVIEATFPKDAKLVVGCKLGGRSAKAAAVLEQAGFTQVVDQTAGFDGQRDPFGQLTNPGWSPKGLPVSNEPEPGRSWAELASAADKGA